MRVRFRGEPVASKRWACASVSTLLMLGAACDTATTAPAGSYSDPATAEPEPARPDPGTIEDGAPYTTRLTRLTHHEYDNTLRDLVGVDVEPSADFLQDPSFDGFDNNAFRLKVAGRLGRDYRRAAESAAMAIASDTAMLSALTPCREFSKECAEDFIKTIGLRAFRRPATEAEVARYQVLFFEGPEWVQSGDDFADGARMVLEAMLQSPKFLYRAELSTDEDESGFVPLNNYEIANRLAYMLTGSMPDAELFEAAALGRLDEPQGVAEQAARLAETPGFSARVQDFHAQWLDTARFTDLSKDGALFPEFSSELSLDYTAEVQHFIDYTLLAQGRGLTSLLTAHESFVNERTAPFYGLSAADFGAEFQRVELGDGERSGLLTQLGFLAAHAYSDDTSPIHRGVYVLRRILCQEVPDPPGGVDFTLPETSADVVTTRDQVEAHTASAACAACHSVINPLGFAFEGYDAVGRLRTTDNEVPVDTSGALELQGVQFRFDDAVDLIAQVAESDIVRKCYAVQWLRYAYQRGEAPADANTLAQLASDLADDSYSVRQLVVDLTRPRAFTHRAPTEKD